MAATLYFLCCSYTTTACCIQARNDGSLCSNHRLSVRMPSLTSLSRVKYACFPLFAGISSNSNAPRRRHVQRKREAQSRKLSDSPAQANLEAADRVPFDINLAVVLAGFAFEAYNTPSNDLRKHETDPFECKTIFLSEQFLREVYDGQIIINLKRGSKFPGLDLWGTSDPYVVLRVDENVIRSKTVWATTEPVWNEKVEINVKQPSDKYLQIAAWDANLVTDHRRLGNSGVNLGPLTDGEKHEVTLELEGMGGGGFITLEIQYKSFEVVDTANRGWRIPVLSDFLQGQRFEDVFSNAIGLESLTVQDFVGSVLGSFPRKSIESSIPDSIEQESLKDISSAEQLETSDVMNTNETSMSVTTDVEIVSNIQRVASDDKIEEGGSDVDLLRILRDSISQRVGIDVNRLRLPLLDSVNWDALDVINKLGLESRHKAELQYVEKGLAVPPIETKSPKEEYTSSNGSSSVQESLPIEDIKKASMSLLKQTDQALKSWAVLAASVTGSNDNQTKMTNTNTVIITEVIPSATVNEGSSVSSEMSNKKLSTEEHEELRKMFGKAESAMEAWSVLATSLGQKSFVKSAFEKLCFLDNSKTDTQVAIWRDTHHRRLVVSFRGTEQVKWKDLMTDLMILPVSFSPERVGGEFKEEAMVHGGFLSAYDSVRNRLMTLVRGAIGASDEQCEAKNQWQVFVTGHSLGGALATLLALELSTSWLARHGQIKVTMYNFGSPRVGNKKFAERYNEIVKDSWRVVNHRDIIPTVPRLMGYCHVAQPIYLTAGDVYGATVNMELIEDGYQGDLIGEATPDFLIEEFMKGEKSLIEKLLQTEITMLRAIRDGTALMQHMEDFYYISLLESVSPEFRARNRTNAKDKQ